MVNIGLKLEEYYQTLLQPIVEEMLTKDYKQSPPPFYK
jgi:hypothetical protein